ncbi:hypothetical protein ACFR9U_18090 [Halorientalis brevis]|uniref:DUF3267 domain-containing protein n=1 Tax=Halorientalis brevis TaxID=1126241 RepID=A0ABD6CG25_9EURY|nr:hypothetical protein [Halorientalis brevis]
MSSVELVAAGVTLVVTVALGTVVHEGSHALALRAFGVPYELSWLPATADGETYHGLFGALASVRPLGVRQGSAPWSLRIAAMMPLCMSVPVVLMLAGVLPDPVASGNLVGTAAVIGWLACALPSPQDFSILWYADRAIRAQGDSLPS